LIIINSCGSDENTDDKTKDAGSRPDSSTKNEPTWTIETVATGGKGVYTRLVLDQEQPLIAFYASQSRDGGPCEEVGGETPPQRMFWDLYMAEKSGDRWQIETVTEVLFQGQPPGLDFSLSPDGTPVVIALTGEPIGRATNRYCGANDVGYFERRGEQWTVQTVVAESGEAAVSGEGASASNYGEVVGYWPALSFDSQGNAAIAYQDRHSGNLQSDDWARADLELAMERNGSWNAIAVDYGQGAGEYNRMIFDDQDRPIIIYHQVEPRGQTSESQEGLWATRSDDGGTTWQKVRLHPMLIPFGPDLVINPQDGSLYVIFYNASKRLPYLLTLIDDDQFESYADGWDFEQVGDKQYDEGRYSSIAIHPFGLIGVAYYRCKRVSPGEACDSQDDALVFAWREMDEIGAWHVEVVDEGVESGTCGIYPSLAFDEDGSALISYLCQELVDDRLDDQVRMARRKPL